MQEHSARSQTALAFLFRLLRSAPTADLSKTLSPRRRAASRFKPHSSKPRPTCTEIKSYSRDEIAMRTRGFDKRNEHRAGDAHCAARCQPHLHALEVQFRPCVSSPSIRARGRTEQTIELRLGVFRKSGPEIADCRPNCTESRNIFHIADNLKINI